MFILNNFYFLRFDGGGYLIRVRSSSLIAISAVRLIEKGRFVMTMKNIVTDEQLGKYYRRTIAIADRLGKSLPIEKVMHALQCVHDGKFNSILKIDRTKPFTPSYFRGSENVELHMKIVEEDPRALATKLIDCDSIVLTSGMHTNETVITNDERIKRLKMRNAILLDALVMIKLWENPWVIPDTLKCDEQGKQIYLAFDGTIFTDNDVRCIFYLYWSEQLQKWMYGSTCLCDTVSDNFVSVTLHP